MASPLACMVPALPRPGGPGISHQSLSSDAARQSTQPRRTKFADLARDAEKNCPVIKAEIVLDAKLAHRAASSASCCAIISWSSDDWL